MQQATWNHAQYLSVLSWTMLSSAITSAQLFLVFFPFGNMDEYVLGWPLGLSLTANAILVIASALGRRDQHVRVSLTDNGIQYDDESESYRRKELLQANEIKKIRVRRNPFFKSLTIDMKENNQRFFLSNVSITDDFLAGVQALINKGTS
ncbi:hypothetical protein [Stutzerimonas stutzeri]|uniref:Uncharacterized protein n=1 Tax=Stutzerimonas stutzeri KOS6 TaxID=1218352 RepID=A0A061JVR7_STUST|nr:hypothetical protein [Stutzerimonas stutzeri]EWC43003.1 hypothetical protein B597_002510 [Stutzerimonas stutzeri KOS6]